VRHLMLREEVIEAVEQSLFHIYPVRTVDEAITILTGVEAGEQDEEGNYPPDSVNGRVQARLKQLAEQLKACGREAEKKPKEEDVEAEQQLLEILTMAQRLKHEVDRALEEASGEREQPN